MTNPDPVTAWIAEAREYAAICAPVAGSYLARALDMIEAARAELRSIRADAGALDNYGPFDKGLDHACHRIEAALRKVVQCDDA